MLAWGTAMPAASKNHLVVFGKPVTVPLFLGSDGAPPLSLKIRALYVDGKLKEFTTGATHDITDRQFVVQRAFRINDSLPEDPRSLPKWQWQRGTWLLVDRSAGRVSALRLPHFDPFYSEAAWYRDYAAYCGVSDTGEKLMAVVAQLGVHKAIALSSLRSIEGNEAETPCRLTVWQRNPARATFALKEGKQVTLTIRGTSADAVPAESPAPSEETE
jgi:hypothetical protein